MDAAATLRAVASFAIVIGLLVAFVWILRRGSLGLTGGRTRPVIAIETAASLGDRRSLVIVSVEGRRWLLGLAPGSVSTVAELTRAAAAPPPAVVEGPN
jgi:flagellar protein FliO/FliZ